MGRTIGIDEKTYKELVRLTAHFMQKTEEQISLSDIVRLSVYLFKGCLDSYPELGNQILNQIDFGDQKKSTKDNDFDEQKEPRDYLSKDITPEWFGKDFLDFIFGVEDLRKRCSESDN